MGIFKRDKQDDTVELIPTDIRFSCTKCGQKFKIGKEYAGQTAACSSCGVTVQIPVLEQTNATIENIPASNFKMVGDFFKRSVRKPLWIIVFSLLFITSLLLCYCYYFTNFYGVKQSKSSGNLSITMEYKDRTIILNNNNTFDWTDITITVNGIYSGQIESIASGGMHAEPIMRIHKSDGEMFNPNTHLPLAVTLRCNIPNGKGYYNGWFIW